MSDHYQKYGTPTVKLTIALVDALRKVASEWERQKGLFPELAKDGWMDQAIGDALSLVESLRVSADE